MIIPTILATCFSILQHCCAQSLPYGFHQSSRIRTEDLCQSAHKIRAHLHGKTAPACAEFVSAGAEDPQHPYGRSVSFHTIIGVCLHGTTTKFLRKANFSVSCTVHLKWWRNKIAGPNSGNLQHLNHLRCKKGENLNILTQIEH